MPASTHRQQLMSFQSQLGWFGIAGTSTGLRYLTFGHKTEKQVQQAMQSQLTDPALVPSPKWAKDAQKLLVSYASGIATNLNKIPLDRGPLTDFQESVLHRVCAVEYGSTITYGELADQAGSPRAARAVGTFMSKNTIPLVIPCHRVLGSGGKLGGYSAPDGLSMKAKLLKLENPSNT